jgi:predicted RND superfamily exporter protein
MDDDEQNIVDAEVLALQEELDHFRHEKEKVRNLVGQIGGVKSTKRDTVITVIFAIAIFVVFLFDVLRHFIGVEIPLPPLFSLGLGVLLVSAKIIWMIHKQAKVEHFQFWILNSIEFRLNDIAKKIDKIEERLDGSDSSSSST